RTVHDWLAAAARRSALRTLGPEGRAQGQERAIFDGRQRTRTTGGRRRRMRGPGSLMAPARPDPNQPYPHASSTDQSGDGSGPYQFLADRRSNRATVVERPEPAEHPDPHRDRAEDP